MPSAIAFDIDGVFKYGREWSEDGLGALQKVSQAGMPFVFVTNGGGGLDEATYGCARAPCRKRAPSAHR
jgi:ribonucleotide monophosphatase NagD (HAD superfamily)